MATPCRRPVVTVGEDSKSNVVHPDGSSQISLENASIWYEMALFSAEAQIAGKDPSGGAGQMTHRQGASSMAGKAKIKTGSSRAYHMR